MDSLTCPDDQRTIARHTVSLDYEKLVQSAIRLLKNKGFFSVIIPTENRSELETHARLNNLFISRVCLIKTTPDKKPKRQLIEFRKQPLNKINTEEGIIEVKPNVRSDWYQQLTQEFYIR